MGVRSTPSHISSQQLLFLFFSFVCVSWNGVHDWNSYNRNNEILGVFIIFFFDIKIKWFRLNGILMNTFLFSLHDLLFGLWLCYSAFLPCIECCECYENLRICITYMLTLTTRLINQTQWLLILKSSDCISLSATGTFASRVKRKHSRFQFEVPSTNIAQRWKRMANRTTLLRYAWNYWRKKSGAYFARLASWQNETISPTIISSYLKLEKRNIYT